MYQYFSYIIGFVALSSFFVSFWFFLRKKKPNDISLGFALVTLILLIVQIFVAALAPVFGNSITGDIIEFVLYFFVVVCISAGVILWSIINRTIEAVLVLSLSQIVVIVMIWRMHTIWNGVLL